MAGAWRRAELWRGGAAWAALWCGGAAWAELWAGGALWPGAGAGREALDEEPRGGGAPWLGAVPPEGGGVVVVPPPLGGLEEPPEPDEEDDEPLGRVAEEPEEEEEERAEEGAALGVGRFAGWAEAPVGRAAGLAARAFGALTARWLPLGAALRAREGCALRAATSTSAAASTVALSSRMVVVAGEPTERARSEEAARGSRAVMGEASVGALGRSPPRTFEPPASFNRRVKKMCVGFDRGDQALPKAASSLLTVASRRKKISCRPSRFT